MIGHQLFEINEHCLAQLFEINEHCLALPVAKTAQKGETKKVYFLPFDSSLIQ